MGKTIERFPLFPLGLVLLPGELVPLHIFEERYKLMIGECLEEESEFGIIWLSDDGLKEVGCAARITRVLERFEDGRHEHPRGGHHAVQAQRRIEDLPYPAGDVELLADDGETDEEALERARSRLRRPGRGGHRRRAPSPRRSRSSTRTGWPPRSRSRPRRSRPCWSCAPSAAGSSSSRPCSRRRLQRIRIAERAAERASGNGHLKG